MGLPVPIGELLPHGPEMTLIERLVEYSQERSVASVTIRRDSPFFEGSGVPSWVGIEYMAQTIAAHAGYEARLRGQAPAIGFLLGTRSYRSEVGTFELGTTLTISVQLSFADSRLGVYQCSIAAEEHSLATAVVNIYRPAAEELEAMRRAARE